MPARLVAIHFAANITARRTLWLALGERLLNAVLTERVTTRQLLGPSRRAHTDGAVVYAAVHRRLMIHVSSCFSKTTLKVSRWRKSMDGAKFLQLPGTIPGFNTSCNDSEQFVHMHVFQEKIVALLLFIVMLAIDLSSVFAISGSCDRHSLLDLGLLLIFRYSVQTVKNA